MRVWEVSAVEAPLRQSRRIISRRGGTAKCPVKSIRTVGQYLPSQVYDCILDTKSTDIQAHSFLSWIITKILRQSIFSSTSFCWAIVFAPYIIFEICLEYVKRSFYIASFVVMLHEAFSMCSKIVQHLCQARAPLTSLQLYRLSSLIQASEFPFIHCIVLQVLSRIK